MKIVEKNEGTKIPYSLSGTKLTLNDEITLDMSKYERDFAVHIDVCLNPYGMLTMGLSNSYVAQVDIPVRQFTYKDDGVDDKNVPIQKKVPVVFSADSVTLTLWKVE
nr:hypothetical protein [uncultured Caproiciproducens sp.]